MYSIYIECFYKGGQFFMDVEQVKTLYVSVKYSSFIIIILLSSSFTFYPSSVFFSKTILIK